MVWHFLFIHLPLNCQYYTILSAKCNYSGRMCVSGQTIILLCFRLEKDENILISYAECHHVKKQTAQDQTELPFDGLRD
jgi:hypothetical protein